MSWMGEVWFLAKTRLSLHPRIQTSSGAQPSPVHKVHGNAFPNAWLTDEGKVNSTVMAIPSHHCNNNLLEKYAKAHIFTCYPECMGNGVHQLHESAICMRKTVYRNPMQSQKYIVLLNSCKSVFLGKWYIKNFRYICCNTITNSTSLYLNSTCMNEDGGKTYAHWKFVFE